MSRRKSDWIHRAVQPAPQAGRSELRRTAVVPGPAANALGSPGRPLDAATRAFMEPRFGHDFSRVRVHTDGPATESARAVQARAFSMGDDLVFGERQYAPASPQGSRLLAHELAHVVQERQGGDSTDSESRAWKAAEKVGQGGAAEPAALGGASEGIHRAPEEPQTAMRPGLPDYGLRLDPSIGSLHLDLATLDEFVLDSASLTSAHREQVAALASSILLWLPKMPSPTVTLTGHTDATGSEAHNLELGRQRALSVGAALAGAGVPLTAIRIKSEGESALKVKTQRPEPRNRRVEVRLEGGPALTFPSTPSGQVPTPEPKGTEGPPRAGKAGDVVGPKPPPGYLPGEREPAPLSSAGPEKGGLPKVEAAVVADPLARAVESTVEVAWEAKSGLGKKLKSEIGFTIHVGPNGLTQIESDLTLVKKRIADTVLGGTVRELTFSVGFNPGLNFDKNTAGSLVSEFQAKVKAALEADLTIPKTSAKIPIEISGSVDPRGKLEWEVKFKLFTW